MRVCVRIIMILRVKAEADVYLHWERHAFHPHEMCEAECA